MEAAKPNAVCSAKRLCVQGYRCVGLNKSQFRCRRECTPGQEPHVCGAHQTCEGLSGGAGVCWPRKITPRQETTATTSDVEPGGSPSACEHSPGNDNTEMAPSPQGEESTGSTVACACDETYACDPDCETCDPECYESGGCSTLGAGLSEMYVLLLFLFFWGVLWRKKKEKKAF